MRRIFKGLGNVKRAIASFAGPFAVRTSKLPGFINGIEVLAFPDTGAEGNVMSFSFAEKHHLKILKGSQQCSVFKLANGRKVRSIGQVDVTWAFEGSSLNEYDLRFNVLPFCSHPVLIGNELLKETKTMSLHRDRLRACVSFRWPVQFANLLGSARERLRGKLNGKTVLALPDSGCEPNLLSEAYVKKRGLTIQKDFRRRAVLQFADGSIQETAGQVKTKWRFSDSQEPMEIVFDVLRGCPFDVVIGRGVLDATEAYVKHAGCFIETDSKTDTSDLNCVTYHTSFLQRFRRTKSVDPVVASKQADDEKRTKELDRRAQADRLINSVTDSVEKASERDRESERRRLWNEARARNRTSRSSTAVAAPSQPSLSYPPPDVSSTMPSRSAAVGA
ncbi:MAG: hypothetical protein M1833_000097 [Piccolia ochrophora]|nr:MAG: hypothetical protein M1833_000097 [Piccolia ochrophora]